MSKPKSRYTYECASCGSGVSKPETGSGQGRKAIKAGLGGWVCQGTCGAKGTKVIRKLKDKES